MMMLVNFETIKIDLHLLLKVGSRQLDVTAGVRVLFITIGSMFLFPFVLR